MKKILRIGIFGGSFDPVHIGHIGLARAAKLQYKLDKVIFVPAKYPPHKISKRLSSPAVRLKMLRAALNNTAAFSVSRFELVRSGTTYTYQTLKHFKKVYPGAELFFLLGKDSLLDVKNWKNAGLLPRLCGFIAAGRAGAFGHAPAWLTANTEFISGKLPTVSSSGIRKDISLGKSVSRLLPRGVAGLIKKYAPYR
ncbi:MAG: nicotinate (nicotinamide) nucleotide adenylyltransferase [Elusimicrobia bacterium RIFOXYA1_FULL_47_7]|nr:MAG: nicotinate (nicotinamide) nucleotide adenylyltransferase [Elusimicrobia bacterium RIFOXYA12_FULL_49_49]OGS09975.1 MAG: nicotinate (nicotinamide) nucleotide adenylyltransferase [Elusimicrobia bacterium RIFOXYB1_FULL_48_9]OGS10296.1 MAG: nicotinate (nicotinamide) nucleotide adenylyltransferase [Elusimicrobia bacterium RIFOXYA1_FULL_47_7]OGS16394.1 MAG: nicotinate (nicotinamide) nucleotide adenylyltransferase [Elusimicrobia bacterium RIFOXYA2_FULL_47_53]OGS27229.1 MAG: nicotinate (nicotina